MQQTVLLVEDEADVVDLVKYHLHRAGYAVLVATNGKAGLDSAASHLPDLLVLDVMLPEMDGFEVCRQLRKSQKTASLPVIMLTAKGAPNERIHGLEAGADDYVPKPFSPRELVLRVQALLRRSALKSASATNLLEIDEFRVDRNTFEITMLDEKLELTTTEFKLLCLLIERRGKTQSRENLLFDVWGYENAIDTRTVDTHVRRLREKLGACAARIETVRGSGYRYVSPSGT